MSDGSLSLVRQDATLLVSMTSASALAAARGLSATDDQLAWLRGHVEQSLAFYERIGASPPWVGYLAVDASGSAVGVCGFKGDPDAEGAVEIAYGTLPDREGRGHATEMVRALVALTRRQPGVTIVLAHTLPERNASCRVLEKAGFAFGGDVVDPDDGPVWRWTLSLGREA